jgi:hypothetical protein
MPDTDPDDERAEDFAQRLDVACRGETNGDVISGLLSALAETIGSVPYPERNHLLGWVLIQLTHYVSEIPPLASDDPESLD